MEKVRLFFKGIAEPTILSDMALVVLVDEENKRSISFICDGTMKQQFAMRRQHPHDCKRFLPEVMAMMLMQTAPPGHFEILITDLKAGVYQTKVHNLFSDAEMDIRLSDAVMLSQICHLPMFIDRELMARQSAPYTGEEQMMVPINVVSNEILQAELDKAVQEENYRLASYIQQELQKRKDQQE